MVNLLQLVWVWIVRHFSHLLVPGNGILKLLLLFCKMINAISITISTLVLLMSHLLLGESEKPLIVSSELAPVY